MGQIVANTDSCAYNPPFKWWGFTGAENEKLSRQQEYKCKWSNIHISSLQMQETA